jgi:hypothetical protein
MKTDASIAELTTGIPNVWAFAVCPVTPVLPAPQGMLGALAIYGYALARARQIVAMEEFERSWSPSMN